MTKYYDLAETAEILGVAIPTLREWIKDGFMLAHKYDGKNKWYISQEEIERLQANMIDNRDDK